MAFKDMFRNLINLNEEDFDEGFEDTAEETIETTEKVKREPAQKRFTLDRKSQNTGAPAAMKVVIVRPEAFDEVAGIADHLVQRKTVVLNLETANKDISRRIVDFMSGAAYALACKLKKVANNTFIIVPEHTDIAGELFVDDFDENSYFM